MTRHLLVPWESTWAHCTHTHIWTLRVLPLPVSLSDVQTAPQQSPLADLPHIYLGFLSPLVCCLKVLEVGVDPLPGLGLGAGQEKVSQCRWRAPCQVLDPLSPLPEAPPCLMHHQTPQSASLCLLANPVSTVFCLVGSGQSWNPVGWREEDGPNLSTELPREPS